MLRKFKEPPAHRRGTLVEQEKALSNGKNQTKI